jgi:hypothetical protein
MTIKRSLLGLGALVALATAAPAGASNVYLDDIYGCSGPTRLDDNKCDTGGDWDQVYFSASRGSANTVKVSRAGDVVTLEDPGSTVTGPQGKQGKDFTGKKQCAATDQHTATCDVNETTNGSQSENGFLSIGVYLADKDDTVDIAPGTGPDGGFVDITGGDGNDKITLGDGNNFAYLSGDAGADQIFGADSPDIIFGGKGRDRIKAGAGDDSLHLRDGERDTADCGPGRKDVVIADRVDRLKGCEKVKRS